MIYCSIIDLDHKTCEKSDLLQIKCFRLTDCHFLHVALLINNYHLYKWNYKNLTNTSF